MQNLVQIVVDLFTKNGLVMAFLVVGIIALFSNFISTKITHGRIHNSAIAIFIGLILAYIGGSITGGEKGFSDIRPFDNIFHSRLSNEYNLLPNNESSVP